MEIQLQKHEAEIDVGYEIYQIIRDFDNPIQIFREAFQNSIDEGATEVCCRVSIEQRLGTEDLIIDIWDNGLGLREKMSLVSLALQNQQKSLPKGCQLEKLDIKGMVQRYTLILKG